MNFSYFDNQFKSIASACVCLEMKEILALIWLCTWVLEELEKEEFNTAQKSPCEEKPIQPSHPLLHFVSEW